MVLSDIIGDIQKPEWWFATILVAVIANVTSNYLYDWLRPRTAGRWLDILKNTYMTSIVAALLFSSLFIPMKPQSHFTIISACLFGFGGILLEVFGFTKDGLPGKAVFMQMITVASLSCLIFLEPNFSNAWMSKDTSWFASEIFTVVNLSLGFSLIIVLAFLRKNIRKRQRLR